MPLDDETMRAALDDRCRRGMTKGLGREFDGECVMRRLMETTGRDREELFADVAAWAESVGGKLDFRQPSNVTRGGRTTGRLDLMLLVPRAWFDAG